MKRDLLAYSLGCAVLLIGFASFVGQCFGFQRLYLWFGDPGMAVNTAVAFCLIGWAMMLRRS